MTSIFFYGFFQILIFGLKGSFILCWLNTNNFGGFLQIISIKKNSYKLWIYSFPFKDVSLAMAYVEKSSSKTTSLLWVKPSIQFQQVSTSFRFYFYLFCPQTFFCNLFWTLGIYKGGTRLLKFLSPSNLP